MINNPPITATPENDFRTNAGTAFDASVILGSIEFRVIRSGAAARRMRINATRCTLGSGEGCTVRLEDPTLRPMHAVILRDANQVMLRAYTVPIEVNGNLIAETFLHVGDCFILGSYQFELVHIPDFGIDRSSVNALSDKPDSSFSLGFAPVGSSSAEVDSLDAPSGESAFSLMSHLLDEEPREPGRRSANAKRPTRLSFIGGVEYVSEAIQSSLSSMDCPRTTLDLSQKATQRLQADQLRREVAEWRGREQKWKEQETQNQAELSAAIARFHQSQQQAAEASDAAIQMRKRISQLTEEMESLAKESASYRSKAERAKERYRKAVDAVAEARDEAIRQRNEAELKVEQSSIWQQELIRERDLIRQERDAAVAERDGIVVLNQDSAEDMRKAALFDAELARMNEEFAAQRASLSVQRDEFQAILKEYEGQAELATGKLAQAQLRIDLLSGELGSATEKLLAARGEVAAAQVQIESLSAEVSKHHETLNAIHESNELAKREYEARIDELRTQVSRLELNYSEVRTQISLADADREVVDSLNAKLEASENLRVADKLSWDQEAQQLHASIQELSHELEAAASKLSQKEAENEATQAELNNSYERLTSVRRELADRPTAEQWDELQKQLVETEQQLAETEQKVIILQQEYDQLRSVNHSQRTLDIGNEPAVISTSSGPASVPISAPVVWALPKNDVLVEANEQTFIPTDESSEIGDHGWPTYGGDQIESFDSVVDSGSNQREVSESVAERLASYTSREKSERLWNAPTKDESHRYSVSANAESSNAEIKADDSGSSGEHGNIVDDNDKAVIPKEPSIGFLAEQLIAELKTEHPATPLGDDSASVSQSIGSWVSHSANWRQNDETSEDAFSDRAETDAAGQEELPLPMNWASGNEFLGEESSDIESESPDGDTDHTFMFNGMSAMDIGHHDVESRSDFSVPVGSSQQGPYEYAKRSTGTMDTQESDFESEVVESEHLSPVNTFSVVEPTVEAVKSEPAPDDDSIEAYMNRLLQRVQGQSNQPVEKTVQTTAPSVDYSQPTYAPKTAIGESSPTLDPSTTTRHTELIDPSTPIVPRSQAPEDAGHLAAMRELANASANSAISQSVRGQAEKMKSKAIVDLFQAGVVLGCAFAFYTCGEKIPSLRYVWFTAAALAVALSVFFIHDMLKKLSAAKTTFDDIAESPDLDDVP